METGQNLKIGKIVCNYSSRAVDNKITTIVAQLRGDTAGIYVQKKIDQIENYDNIQDWKKFIEEIKTMFSNKSKTADCK